MVMPPLMCPRACQIFIHNALKNILKLRTYVHTFHLFPTSLSPGFRPTSQVTENSRESSASLRIQIVNKYKVIEEKNEKVERKCLKTCALGFSSRKAHASQGEREGFVGVA